MKRFHSIRAITILDPEAHQVGSGCRQYASKLHALWQYRQLLLSTHIHDDPNSPAIESFDLWTYYVCRSTGRRQNASTAQGLIPKIHSLTEPRAASYFPAQN